MGRLGRETRGCLIKVSFGFFITIYVTGRGSVTAFLFRLNRLALVGFRRKMRGRESRWLVL